VNGWGYKERPILRAYSSQAQDDLASSYGHAGKLYGPTALDIACGSCLRCEPDLDSAFGMAVLAIITIRATVPPFGHNLKMRIEKLALSDEEELVSCIMYRTIS
jgi:hypothetical protein